MSTVGPGSSEGIFARVADVLDQNSNTATLLKPLSFPEDFYPHPEVRAESIAIQAILEAEDQQSIEVSVQFDRLAIDADASGIAESDSAWEFSNIMRSSVVFNSLAGRVGQRENLQRGALDLAGADQSRFWIGADLLTVRADRRCQPEYQLRAHTENFQVLKLQWSLPGCPAITEAGLFNQWQMPGIHLTGTLAVRADGQMVKSQAVTGTGLISHAFGNLPFSSGAVLFDRLQLWLDDGDNSRLDLSVLRSKRITGRGPRPVSASVTESKTESDEFPSRRMLELEWQDQEVRVSDASGLSYPDNIKLIDKKGEFSLQLVALHGLTEVTDSLGTRLKQAVSVSGSHTGMGFLEYQPLEKE